MKAIDVLNETYEIIEEIGSGGGGVVYHAIHKRLQTDVGNGGVNLGTIRTHDYYQLNVTDGVFDGELSVTVTRDNDSGTMYPAYVRGIGKIVEKPEFFSNFLPEEQKIICWTYSNSSSIIWQWFRPEIKCVEGLQISENRTATSIALE